MKSLFVLCWNLNSTLCYSSKPIHGYGSSTQQHARRLTVSLCSLPWSCHLPRPASGIRKTNIFSPDQWNVVPDQELETPDHFLIWFLTIIFVRIEIQSVLKLFRIDVLDGSGGFLSSGSPSGSDSPDDWGRMFYPYLLTRVDARNRFSAKKILSPTLS